MVRPAHFGPNAETAASNVFQHPIDCPAASLEAAALDEFDGMVNSLRTAGARVIVFADTDEPAKPDAVFPNNWITTHANGDVFLFPLEATIRRAERRLDIVAALSAEHGFAVRRVVDLSSRAAAGEFLEGTGSMVLDRMHEVAYAARSSRTNPDLLKAFALDAGYDACAFDAVDNSGRPIYHTNVMMALGERFAVICTAVVRDARQRRAVTDRLTSTGRRIIDISIDQMKAFAGNLLEVRGENGEPVIVLSKNAFDTLSTVQRSVLREYGQLLPVAVDTIERVGGGSVRCMLAEIFLPRADSSATGANAGNSVGL